MKKHSAVFKLLTKTALLQFARMRISLGSYRNDENFENESPSHSDTR